MNRTQKKTLVLLLGILVGLGILLAVLTRNSTDAADTTIPLCGFITPRRVRPLPRWLLRSPP